MLVALSLLVVFQVEDNYIFELAGVHVANAVHAEFAGQHAGSYVFISGVEGGKPRYYIYCLDDGQTTVIDDGRMPNSLWSIAAKAKGTLAVVFPIHKQVAYLTPHGEYLRTESFEAWNGMPSGMAVIGAFETGPNTLLLSYRVQSGKTIHVAQLDIGEQRLTQLHQEDAPTYYFTHFVPLSRGYLKVTQETAMVKFYSEKWEPALVVYRGLDPVAARNGAGQTFSTNPGFTYYHTQLGLGIPHGNGATFRLYLSYQLKKPREHRLLRVSSTSSSVHETGRRPLSGLQIEFPEKEVLK